MSQSGTAGLDASVMRSKKLAPMPPVITNDAASDGLCLPPSHPRAYFSSRPETSARIPQPATLVQNSVAWMLGRG